MSSLIRSGLFAIHPASLYVGSQTDLSNFMVKSYHVQKSGKYDTINEFSHSLFTI